MSLLNTKRKILVISSFLVIILALPFLFQNGFVLGGGSSADSNVSSSIEGTYYFEDAVSRSTVTIYGSTWSMETTFGRSGYSGEHNYDQGTVRGNVLYYSGAVVYGRVNGNELHLAGRTYRKR